MSVEELSVRVAKMEKVAKLLGVKLPLNTKWVKMQCVEQTMIFSRKDGDDASLLLAVIKAEVSCLLLLCPGR